MWLSLNSRSVKAEADFASDCTSSVEQLFRDLRPT
jgi:hypothetical protein